MRDVDPGRLPVQFQAMTDRHHAEALEFLLDRMRRTKTNKEFLDSMARG